MIKPRTLTGFMELPGAPAADGAHYGHPAPHLFSLRLHAAGHRHRDAQILLAKGGGETEKQIYRFTKGDSDLALRLI